MVIHLPLATRLALSYASARLKPVFTAGFAFDARVANVVLRATEPMIAQIRLAWLREQVEVGASASIEEIVKLTGGRHDWTNDLTLLIDGWEKLLESQKISDAALEQFAERRGALFAALAQCAGVSDAETDDARLAGLRWATADLAAMGGSWGEIAKNAVACRMSAAPPLRFPSVLRPLAILDGLAQRSLRRGGGPLLGDRLSPLVALRLGIFGR